MSNQKSELISVIIPVYNTSNFLKKCLESVINQTYKNLEIIIIDDNSTDKSRDIIESYAIKDNRIKTIYNNNNVGLSETRNIGINKASGIYITFIDSDDYVDLDFIKFLYISLKEYGVNLVIPQRILFDITLEYFYKDGYHNNSFFIDELEAFKLINKNTLLSNLTHVNVSASSLFNLKIIKDNNIYFPKNIAFEDNVFFYNFLLSDPKSSMLFNNKSVYYYIQNNSSAITKNIYKFRDIITVNYLVKSIFTKFNIYNRYYNSINYYFCNNILYWGLNGRSNSLTKDIEYFKQASIFLKNEIDNKYIDNILKKQHKSYYRKINKIKNSYKAFYYKMFFKDIYKTFIKNRLKKFFKLIKFY